MSISLILKNTHELPTGQINGDLLQQTVLYSKEVVLLVFQRCYQLWNLRQNKQILQTKNDERVFYFCNNAFIDQYNVAFISYQLENTTPYLGSINLKTGEVQKLVDLPQQDTQNYEKLLVITYEKDFEVIISNASKGTILRYYQGKIIEINHDDTNIIESYSLGAYVAYHTTNSKSQNLSYNIVRNGSAIRHITKIKATGGTIKTIKQYDTQNSIIVYSKNNTSTVYIYNHVSGVIMESCQLKFNVDFIFEKGQKKWVACRTVEVEGSYLQVQEIFKNDSESVRRNLPEWERVENPFYLGFTVQSQKGVTNIETLVLIGRQSVYIHILEDMGIVTDFGNQIVKAVINNF